MNWANHTSTADCSSGVLVSYRALKFARGHTLAPVGTRVVQSYVSTVSSKKNAALELAPGSVKLLSRIRLYQRIGSVPQQVWRKLSYS